jgi:hypothetical protein
MRQILLTAAIILTGTIASAACPNYSGTFVDPTQNDFQKVIIKQNNCSSMTFVIQGSDPSTELLTTDGFLRERKALSSGMTTFFNSAHTDQGLKEWVVRVNTQGIGDRYEKTFRLMPNGSIRYSLFVTYKDGEERRYSSIWQKVK